MIVHPSFRFSIFSIRAIIFSSPLVSPLAAMIYRPIIAASVLLRVFIFIEEFRNYD